MRKFLAVAAATLMLAACGGNGSGSAGTVTPGGTYVPPLTHNELASAFVNALNATGQYDVTLAKSSTDKYNYIVIYDWDLDEYDAVSLSGYTVGQNPINYVENGATAYYDLTPLYVNTYLTPDYFEDYWTGVIFEKTDSAPNFDTEAVAAVGEELYVNKHAAIAMKSFGLSLERSAQVVRLAMAWSKQGGKNLSVADQDAFGTAVLGTSITNVMKAAKAKMAGDSAPLDEVVEKAISVNEGMTPESANQLIRNYFGEQAAQ